MDFCVGRKAEQRRAAIARMGQTMARAAATGARSIAASATAALSITRHEVIAATSSPMAGAEAAYSANFQANWSSARRRSEDGWTLIR